jgi:TusA-related sulfurtransferase
MAVEVLDRLRLKCPQPALKITATAPDMNLGDILEILGDCSTLEEDVGTWCERLGKVLPSTKEEVKDAKRIQIPF